MTAGPHPEAAQSAEFVQQDPNPGPSVSHDFGCTHDPCRCTPQSAKVVRSPEDQVFTLAAVVAKEGEPIVLGEHEEILSSSYDGLYFHLVVRVPWDAPIDGGESNG